MEPRTTLVVGASPDPTRYSYMAAVRLRSHGHPVVLFGKRQGSIDGEPIQQELPQGAGVHTVTLYVAPMHQHGIMEGLLALHPARIIFNPGTEHPAFAAEARRRGIEVVEGCTLVMLATGQY